MRLPSRSCSSFPLKLVSSTRIPFAIIQMSRRSVSHSPPPPSKRAKISHLTSEDFKGGLMLAPMVRSGALPTRLFALKHGAQLVWGPEMVDKAMLHSTREVDRMSTLFTFLSYFSKVFTIQPTAATGVVSFNGVSRAIFTCHPVEKPYLIFQLGTADPELAVQAAKMVVNDVSGIDLNCGCPKPFSTHSGMGAALLSTPDLLCSILTALREAMPSHITVSAKIRLLPTQEETLKLVEKICNTGISALTVHCRTRPMRDRDPAVISRLREIVEFVDSLGKGIPVIENGDCLGRPDMQRVLDATGAASVMIARAAESNPSAFADAPLEDVEETLIPNYIRLCKYLGNHWALSKFCVQQFTGKRVHISKATAHLVKQRIAKAKCFEDLDDWISPWDGGREFQDIVTAIDARPAKSRSIALSTSLPSLIVPRSADLDPITPAGTVNPEPPGLGAPGPHAGPTFLPACVSGMDEPSPTPGSDVLLQV
ncbi:hypothetical protein DL96DRAFT_1693606 [Flagelloscypha sp. PMI_526]|nr:hypothetical protein DL96DRAFT_1693606 [Flagelloscypha sp. PMI_526]